MSLIELTGPTEFFISPTGSDLTGDGSALNPYASMQHIYDLFVSKYHFGGFPVTVNVADGEYIGGLTAFGRIAGQVSSNHLLFKGNQSNWANVKIKQAVTSNPIQLYCFAGAYGAQYRFEGMYLDSSNLVQDIVSAGSQSVIAFQKVIFGDSVYEWADMTAYDGGTIYILGDYEIRKTYAVRVCNRAINSNVLTGIVDFTGIKKWQGVFGAGMPLDCFVSDFNIVAGTITLTRNANSSGTDSVAFCNGGACHAISGRNGTIAYLTNAIPGRV